MENPNFLKQKYNLHNADEVKAAATRTEIRSGEKVPQAPAEQITNYLNRFKEITERENPEEKEMGMAALKKVLHDKFVIKSEDIPESYFDNQKRIMREQGHGDVEVSSEQRQQLTEVIITDQKSSLDNWTDYLSSKDATYPDYLKYYAFRSMLSLGEYDKETKQFTKRSKSTTKPFPDLNREALAYVLDAINKKYELPKDQQTPSDDEEFNKIIAGENFAKLYAWAIDKVTPASKERLASTEGKWIKYNQGSDHMPLVESLQGHGTGWCTAGESTAQTQLQNGDFYVYYSMDENGQPKIPRAAIRMSSNSIGEVRGIAPEQNLDPYIGDVVKTKLAEFSDGAAYEKKSADMKQLTEIENKTKKGEQLNKTELEFIYEINSSIVGFGYQKDPRIAEIRDQRNPQEDAPIVFGCDQNQIAYNANEINENTKAYVGEWNPQILKKMPESVEHLYESFPDKKILRQTIELTPKSPEEYTKELIAQGFKINNYAQDMLNKIEALKDKEEINLVSFSVAQLGFPGGATLQQIYDKAKELGLELCPPQVGPEFRLNYKDQPNGGYLRIAMNSITDRDGYPDLFGVGCNDSELGLNRNDGQLGGKWDGPSQFVFRSRK